MRNSIARSIVLALCASSALLATPLILAEAGASDADAVAAITKIENDAVKADLAGADPR